MAVRVGFPMSVPVLESATSSSAPLVVITTLVSTGDPIGCALGSLAHVPGILAALGPVGSGQTLEMQALPRVTDAATCLGFGGISPPWGIIEANDWGMDPRASYG